MKQQHTKANDSVKDEVPDVFIINGNYLVQIQATPKSGLFKFKEVHGEQIYLFEKEEIPKNYWDKLNYGLSGLFGHSSTLLREEGYKHTPGKIIVKNGRWYTEKGEPFYTNWRAGSNNKEEAEANAARIVECWNQHDHLKKENDRLYHLASSEMRKADALLVSNKELIEAAKKVAKELKDGNYVGNHVPAMIELLTKAINKHSIK